MSTPTLTQIFVNLPVTDLKRSIAFYTALGYRINPAFTDENAACVVISETIYVMLLTRPFFAGFTPKAISDAHLTTEALLALSMPNRAAVDEIVRKAVAAGGRTYNAPQDHGWMYSHGFEDPDGHIWEVLYADESQRS
jgi:uncharacterized protein